MLFQISGLNKSIIDSVILRKFKFGRVEIIDTINLIINWQMRFIDLNRFD